MKVKTRKPLPIISHLSDWELIIAFSYCDKLLKPRNLSQVGDFEAISFLFFDGDESFARKTLEKIRSLYTEEYSKRHCN